MIDFNRKPAEKTEAEKEFDALNEKYTEKFGVPYSFRFLLDFGTMEETIADIRRRIAENDPQKLPEYEPGELY